MLSLAILFFGLLLTAVRCPDLPIGRALHATIIVAPAAWLAKTPPLRAAIMLFVLLVAALVWIELGPTLLALDYAPALWFVDMSLYLEVLLTASAVAAATRAKPLIRMTLALSRTVMHSLPSKARPRARAPRFRHASSAKAADDDGIGFCACRDFYGEQGGRKKVRTNPSEPLSHWRHWFGQASLEFRAI